MQDLLTMTLGELLDRNAADFPERPAVIFGGRQVTYRESKDQADALAKGLLSLGVSAGDRVCLWLPNRVEWICAQFAIAKIGAVAVLANTRYRPREMAYILSHSKAVGVILADTFLGNDYPRMLQEARQEARLTDLKWTICVSDARREGCLRYEDIVQDPNRVGQDVLRRAQAAVSPQQTVYIMYTSGTTGQPKGSMTAHGPALKNAFNSGERQRFRADDRLLLFLPLNHCFACVNGILNPFGHGASVVIHDAFDPVQVLRAVERHACTAMYGVPTNFSQLLAAFREGRYDLRTLRTGIVGGGSVHEDLAHGIEREMGIRQLTRAYGMTESTAIISQSSWDERFEERMFTDGTAMPDTEIRVVDPETRADCPPDTAGEFWIRGFHVHKGYYGLAPREDDAPGQDWFRTGDLGTVDSAGQVRVVGRIKDMFKTGGFNVYPVEIEDFLITHPAIEAVAVVGVPDQMMGEIGVAFVQLKLGARATEDDIRQFCAGTIANYKVPRQVRIVPELPRSHATLKIQKHLLRAQWEGEG